MVKTFKFMDFEIRAWPNLDGTYLVSYRSHKLEIKWSETVVVSEEELETCVTNRLQLWYQQYH